MDFLAVLVCLKLRRIIYPAFTVNTSDYSGNLSFGLLQCGLKVFLSNLGYLPAFESIL